MQYGVSSKLVAGQLEKLRDVSMPAAPGSATNATVGQVASVATNAASMVKVRTRTNPPSVVSVTTPNSLKIQGIFWDNAPSAIINGHTVFTNDRFTSKVGGTVMNLLCREIRKDAVRLQNLDTGKEIVLDWGAK